MRCEIVDLSSHGALLRPTTAPAIQLAPGTVVTVDLHPVGGRDWIGQRALVRRASGRGAPFAVWFEAVSAELEDLIEDEVLDELEAERSPRVLVVDRSAQRRRPIVAALRAAGCCPLEASTPLEAIGLIEASHDHLAAAIIAGPLTQTGGPELAQFLIDTHPNIRVAMATDGAPVRRRQARVRDPVILVDAIDADWPRAVRALLDRDN